MTDIHLGNGLIQVETDPGKAYSSDSAQVAGSHPLPGRVLDATTEEVHGEDSLADWVADVDG